MAMLSFDYSRQFSITMYLGILCVPAAWSLSSYKGYRGPPSIAGPRILKKNLCPVNSIPVYREFSSRFNLHLSPSSHPLYHDRPTIPLQLICDDSRIPLLFLLIRLLRRGYFLFRYFVYCVLKENLFDSNLQF